MGFDLSLMGLAGIVMESLWQRTCRTCNISGSPTVLHSSVSRPLRWNFGRADRLSRLLVLV